MNYLQPGIYEHYKKKRYQVIGVAKHSETEEKLALDQPWYGDGGWWVRPLPMFLEAVMVNGKKVPRFKYIADE